MCMIDLTREVVYPLTATKIIIIYTTEAGKNTTRLRHNIN